MNPPQRKTGNVVKIAAFDYELDVSEKACPIPILKSIKTLKEMKSGETLHIITTDKGSLKNVPSMVQVTGDQLLKSYEEDGKFHYLIKKA